MRHWRLISTAVAVAAFTAVIASQTRSGNAVFEQALAKERVEGNLPEAIRLYERVVAEFAADRALAAKALVQVGLCYEKLGREESVRAYERLVRDFADQAERRVTGARAAGGAEATRFRRGRGCDDAGPAGASAHGPGQRPAGAVAGRQQGRVHQLRQRAEPCDLRPGEPADEAAHQLRLDNQLRPTLPSGRPTAGASPTRSAASGPDAVAELRVATLDGKSDLVFRNEANPGKAVAPAGWLPDGSALLVVAGAG